nr:zinc finger, CCCH-type [Tanacetum cinerariifolium]
MEYPSFNHHNRYILPPQQQQPINNNFSDDHRNIYPNHHFMPAQPPPPPYPTYQPPPPPPPPPPSFNPHHPPFTYLEQPHPRVSVRYEPISDPLRVMYPPSSYRNDTMSDSGYYTRLRDDNIVVNEQSVFNDRFSDRLVVDNKPSYAKMSEDERIWNSHGEDDPKWIMKGKKNEYESNKFTRVRDGRDEFKQVQKKSVLQRIGKPNNTNRNNRNSRGKGKDNDKDRDRDRDNVGKDRVEGGRENSPVELDVSFQSNGLVAKAVATPSSPLSDTPSRNRKIKRGSEFGSPVSKFGERLTRSGSSSHGVDSPSSSEKASKKVKGKGKGSVFNGQNGSLSGAVLDDGGVSHKPLSFRLRKKRKMNIGSTLSSFQSTHKDEKFEKSENPKKSESASIDDAVLFPTLEVVSSEVDKASQAMVLANDGPELKNPSLSEKVTMISEPGENEISPNHENVTQKISADANLSLRGDDISATSGQGQIEFENCPTESFAILDATNVSNSLVNGSVEIHETSTALDINSPDPCSDDDVIIVSSESSDSESSLEDLSRKEDECQLSSKLSEDGPIESHNPMVVVEDNVISCSSPKESSSDKDEVTEMVKLVSIPGQTLSHDLSEPSTDETNLLLENELPPLSSTISDTGAAVTDLNDQLGESMPDMLTNIVSSDKSSSISDLQLLSSKSTDKTVSTLSIPKNDDSICKKSDLKDDALLDRLESFVEKSKAIVRTSNLEGTKTIPSTSQGSSAKTLGFNPKVQGPTLPMKKPSSVPVVPRVFPGRSSMVFANSRVNNPVTNNIAKPRTWHRSTSNSASLPPPPKQAVLGQNSYVRSGNSLVRKPASATAIPSLPSASRSSVYKLNPSAPTETRNSAGLGNKAPNTYTRTGGSAAPVVRPNTPPLLGITKLPDCPTYSRDVPSSPLEQRPASPVEENLAVQKVLEDRICSSSNSEKQKTLDEGAAGKKIQYVKPKSNQLVAASSSDQSVVELDKTRASPSDGYYKRRKNQLIRTSAGDDSVNTDGHKDSKISIKRHSGIYKKYKHLRFPSVWTLGSQSGKDGVPLHRKLMPNLFPWKRSRNWVNVMNKSASIPGTSSSSSISRKLLLSRKRETIYTRSKHGFSLRMSKLMSVGGSGLKWSKSIEKNSRRANEEATLAVAAAEKKKREQNGTASTTADQKSSMPRDRIFRIGLVRYKMDPSRRTLQRISDEESSTSVQSKEVTRRVYVPKRLKIGHDEYVRFGNGNQLVRNPKRRTRIFASEKVRWSLHTARSRLAKKKKYCQFFTRFGKCNKDDGKCPYIHDSSKIAVCTKFLNGSCSNTNCKLTHKVIPERMQDCSYFMQGVCSNKECPYRHVNVNSAASICEGFLKGYCADGDECRKKHTYACPVFEATGACPQGSKCKLHHPKNRKTGLKRKQQHSLEQNQKNSRGRYFGSFRGGEAMPISEKHYLRDDDGDMLCQGELTEYISLGFSDEEAGEVTSGQRTTVISSESVDLEHQMSLPAQKEKGKCAGKRNVQAKKCFFSCVQVSHRK